MPHHWERFPWRWAVERTFSWLNNSRRLSKDYEFSVSSSESIGYYFSLTYFVKTFVNTGS
jgi:transposase